MLNLIFRIVIVLSFAINTYSAEDLSGYSGTVYFSWDGEAQSYSADSGSATFTHLGGSVSGSEGDAAADCTADTINTSTYHYSILSTDTAAQSSVPGSSYSLKTPYDGDCNNESTSRDTTIITLASDVTEVYIRWYQKWTGNWMNGSVQQKFSKFTPKSYAGNDLYSTGYWVFNSGAETVRLEVVNNIDGQFDGDGVTSRHSVCNIYTTETGAGSQYEGVNRYWDNYDNQIDGGSDGEYTFSVDTWYRIEMHIKINSDATTADAVAEMWVDGNKIFGLSSFQFWDAGTVEISGVGVFELQHIYYDRATNDDQPTYIDNIVIGSSYIGAYQGDGTGTIGSGTTWTMGAGATGTIGE